MIPNPAALGSGGGGTWTLTISANAANVNLKTELEALYGSMSSAVVAVVTINSGVEISCATGSGYPAMETGTSWPSGSTLKIVNYGKIRGAGGLGASGGSTGVYGGDALSLGINVTIDNTSVGNIFGGGGGGGHGGQIPAGGNVGGGGGGGGQGDDGGGGGPHETVDITYEGADGNAGSETGPGAGGPGGSEPGGDYLGGAGGYGGGWGAAGSAGNSATVYGVPAGGGLTAGGAAGKAIDKNGKTVTWIAGNNATQVKGAVS